MTATQLLAKLKDLDVKLLPEGETLRFNAPAGVMTSQIIAELSRLKPEIMELLRRAAETKRKDVPAIEPVERDSELPLSYGQQRLWYLDQLEPGSPRYNIPAAFRLEGNLERAALCRSLAAIVHRHEALRTVFPSENGRPVQRVLEPEELQVPVQDLSGSTVEEKVKRFLLEEQQQGFDLEHGPLFRARLLALGENVHVLAITMHHIVGDGWSLGLFFQELAKFYQAFAKGGEPSLKALPVQYGDFSVWQRQRLSGEVLEGLLRYWRAALAGLQTLQLPTDRPRPAVQTFLGSREALIVPRNVHEKLLEFSRQEGVTLFMTLLAAYVVLLHRYTGQADIVVGSPVANRNRAETEGLIGFFVNMLVMRVKVCGDGDFRQLIRQVRDIALGAYDHQDLPFEKLVEELHPDRDMSRNPLFQVTFALQNAPMAPLELEELTLSQIPPELITTRFDLEMNAWEGPQGLVLSLMYNTSLFDSGTIRRILRHYQNLLEAIVANPGDRLASLPLQGDMERRQMLFEWNATATDFPKEETIPALFEQQVERIPDKAAVVYDGRTCTYEELNIAANQLAHRLLHLGVCADAPVAVLLERSTAMVMGWLGILKAGGVYVPLDQDYPKERLEFMLNDSNAQILLTNSAMRERLPVYEGPILYLDDDGRAFAEEPQTNPVVNVLPTHLAYIIYTSGSTGEPKGVAVPHRAVNRLVCDTDYLQVEPEDRVAQASNASFDAATFEVWGALLNGAQLVGVDRETTLSPHQFADFLEQKAITVLFITTALFNQMARTVPDSFRGLRALLFGGEAVDPVWVRQVLENAPPRYLLHVYGPTETTTFATWYRIEKVDEDARTVPIGRPIANTRAYILDRGLQPVPVGVYGELYIGGEGLARGYLNRPGLTDKYFLPDPFLQSPESRLYRTGDLVRYREDGTIEFQGRVDHQVKIRGFRIELGEIEAVLTLHPAVQEAAVLCREDTPGDKRLAGYLVVDQERALTISEIRYFLQEKLPAYMVPSAFIILDSLPLTSNGKLDRGALPAPEGIRPEMEGNYVAPRSRVESVLAEIWCEMLGIEQVGIHDKFFDLGGHSLLLIQVINAVEQQLDVRLKPMDLMFNTLAEIAALCEEGAHFPEADKPIPGNRPAGEPFFFGAPDKPLFGFYQELPSGAFRNTGIVLCYPMGEEYNRFHRSFQQLADHLANTGFPVLRFDYHGCGDSGGESEEGTLRQWMDDISSAISEIRRRGRVKRVCLVGLRMGGTLAMLAGAKRGDIDGMVLLDPIVEGPGHLDELISWHKKMLRYAHVMETGRKKGSYPVEILGFPMTPSLLKELEDIDLLTVNRKPAADMLVIESRMEEKDGPLVAHLENMEANVAYNHAPFPELWERSDRFMIEDVSRVIMPYQIIKSVVSWLSEGFT